MFTECRCSRSVFISIHSTGACDAFSSSSSSCCSRVRDTYTYVHADQCIHAIVSKSIWLVRPFTRGPTMLSWQRCVSAALPLATVEQRRFNWTLSRLWTGSKARTRQITVLDDTDTGLRYPANTSEETVLRSRLHHRATKKGTLLKSSRCFTMLLSPT